MEIVNDKITNQLELGIIKEETKKEFIDIIKDMQEKENIEAIILGCTELPLILNEDNCPIPCMDTLKIHINALADMILKEPLIN